jgi:ArsR family transcriptional regulator, arsenate/arsenite/antimonite-responsive transcriptional repressor
MRDLSNLFRALADPNRLRIMNILSHQCMCVCDLQTALGLSQSLISRHLACLRHAGLVQDHRSGTWVCYSPMFQGTYGPAVRSLILQILPLTSSLQTDLEKLHRHETLGELKHCVVPAKTGERVSSQERHSGQEFHPTNGR